MKPPAFSYERVADLGEAIAMLAESDLEAVPIAGGQSLVAALALRLSAPARLVDISRIAALKGIAAEGGELRIGALATHNQVGRSPLVAARAPLLARAAPWIAHEAIRNRGTIGGSLAYADPAAEWPAAALALGAGILLEGPAGAREVPAEAFFTGLYETARRPGEIVVGLRVPERPAGERVAFAEIARRRGDFAVIGLAATASGPAGDEAGAPDAIRLAFFGVGARPVLARRAAAALAEGGAVALDRALEALGAELEPFDDLAASAEMRIHLARTLFRRAAPELLGRGGPADA